MGNSLLVPSSIGIVLLCVHYLFGIYLLFLILLILLLIVGKSMWTTSNYKQEETAIAPQSMHKIISARRAASEEGMKHLRNMFEELEQFLQMKEFDKELQDELTAACPNYMTVLLTAKRDLLRSDCGIVITGATSAGKTTLVNLIIEREKLKVFSKDEVLRKEVKVDDIKKLKANIRKFTDISQLQNEIPDAYFVDVYLPVSILKVAAQKKTEFTKDYHRFKKVLKETIDKNQNKRMKFYYSFLQTFTCNAERGTLARLTLLERSEDEHKKIVMKNRENIEALTRECSQAKIILGEYKTDMVLILADKLRNYLMSSDGKNEVLNPSGCTCIKDVSYMKLHEEIPRRIENGIKRWCEGRDVKAMMEEADAKIRSLLKDIEGKLQNIETDLTGINFRYRNDASEFALLGIGFLFLSPLALVFAFVFGFALAPIVAIWAFLAGNAWHERQVSEIYNKCLESLHRQALVESFEKSFGAEYNKVIVSIFEETLPMKFSSLKKLNEKLLVDQKQIIQKRKSFERLKKKMESLRKETDLFKKTCAQLLDI